MCLIIDKPAGAEIPAEWLINSYTYNRDGWGIMWAEGGSVRVQKGFKLQSLVSLVQKRPTDQHVAVHMRAGTSGKRNVHNCHPINASGVWIMHNGIIAIPNKIAKWSDTMHFAQFCLAPILSTYPSLFGTEMLRGMLEYFVGKGNKLLLMNGDGNVVILNEKEGTNKEGCWISNTYSIYHHHMYEYENWENDWEYPVVRREQLTAVMPTQAISPPAAEFSSGSPNGENHFCEGCQLSMRADDWMHISGLGYFCPTCATVLEHDFKTIGPFSLNDAALMGYQALKDLCKNSPETVAYMLMNEYRQ